MNVFQPNAAVGVSEGIVVPEPRTQLLPEVISSSPSLNRNPNASDIFWAHKNAEAYLDIDLKTAQDYRVAYLNFLEAVDYHRRGFDRRHFHPRQGDYLTVDDYPTVAKMPVPALTPVFCEKFKAAWVKGIHPVRQAEKYQRALRGADAMLAMAQAMFSPKAKAVYKRAGLILPHESLAEFVGYRLVTRIETPRVTPDEEPLLLANALLDDLEKTNPDMFLVAGLAHYDALSFGEMVAFRMDWIVETADGLFIKVWKGDEKWERTIPLHPRLVPHLLWRTSEFVFGATAYKREQIVRATARWLKQHGFNGVLRALAQFRDYGLWYLRSVYSRVPGKFSSYAGHRLPATTMRFLIKPAISEKLVEIWRNARAIAPPVARLNKSRRRARSVAGIPACSAPNQGMTKIA